MTRRAAAALAAIAVALLSPAAAQAARGQQTMMEDSTQLLTLGQGPRDFALDQFKALGTDIVKVRVEWRDFAPDASSRRKPDFDATDPGAYPSGAWDALDAAVRGIVSRGMKPFLMVGPPAPDWATAAASKKYVGVWKSDPAEYGKFVTAIGRRYSGVNEGLPRVSMWSVWNEPNHPQFIQPLSERIGGKMVPTAADQYRRLYVAATDAFKVTGHGSDTLLFGEVLPIGQRKLGTLNTISPLLWLREFFCLDSKYRPFKGSAARARGCSPYPKIVTSGFAMHPYTKPVGPRYHLPNPDDATIGQIPRVTAALDRIAKTHRIRKGLPIYSTEFGIQTDPPDCVGFGAPITRQAAIINEAEYDSYLAPRVKTYSQYLLIDDPILTQFDPGSNERYGRFQTGLLWGQNAVRCESPGVQFKYATPKQPTFNAFQTPIYVRALSHNRGVQVLGRARPRGHASQSISILHNGRRVASVTAAGYFLKSVRRASSGKWQLRWTFNGVTYSSRVASALPDPPVSAR
ncbi:MAG: polysaccharide biosynthesis protein PslG [Thermoleophilaceae bacterium]|nr:polysaccharide biosynthesis protein PslG [Thermoleophilaceae bacterium]